MSRSTELRLRRAFAEILTTCLATTAGATVIVSCGGGSNDGGQQPDGYASVCGKASTPLLLGVEAEPPIDYIAERYESAFAGPDAGNADQWEGYDQNSAGTKCATATDKAACEKAAASYRVLPTDETQCRARYASGEVEGCRANYLLYTRKDEVGSAQKFDQVRALIGTVSNLDEALLLAEWQDYSVNCSEWPRSNRPPESAYRANADGSFDLRLLRVPDCDFYRDCYVHVDRDGTVREESCTKTNASTGCVGRRPEGFVGSAYARDAEAGEYFAHMAELEAASVVAFQRLHRDLKALGAPAELLARIRKAEQDEVRHTRDTEALARRHGGEPSAPCIDEPLDSPTPFSIALENAREGCVRETYGALVAHVQAAQAVDPIVAACMRIIAEEETEHAALSWDIAAWLEPRLEARERAVLHRERELTVIELAGSLARTTVSETARRIAGLPLPEDAVALLASLEPTVLAA